MVGDEVVVVLPVLLQLCGRKIWPPRPPASTYCVIQDIWAVMIEEAFKNRVKSSKNKVGICSKTLSLLGFRISLALAVSFCGCGLFSPLAPAKCVRRSFSQSIVAEESSSIVVYRLNRLNPLQRV